MPYTQKTLNEELLHRTYRWYRDRTTDGIFSKRDYPFAALGRKGVALCRYHGNNMVHKGLVLYDNLANDEDHPDQCFMCNRE